MGREGFGLFLSLNQGPTASWSVILSESLGLSKNLYLRGFISLGTK